MQIYMLFIVVGLLLYIPNWSRGEVKEVGRILLFCGLLVLALKLGSAKLL